MYMNIKPLNERSESDDIMSVKVIPLYSVILEEWGDTCHVIPTDHSMSNHVVYINTSSSTLLY